MISFSTFNLDEFIWANRFEWVGVVQTIERALNGAQQIENVVVSQGRPIALTSSMEEFAVFEALQNHAASNQGAFTLTINGTAYNVVWHHESLAVSGEPVIDYSDVDPTHFQNVKLNFITV